ncbi:DUF4255 domain-containing protein [Algoriphagus sp.]|uniref:DUF4255 domain-containing protein n=1 Tax=Algoriphagus sp. TaxID=1872435 RepID=UPI003F6EFBB0
MIDLIFSHVKELLNQNFKKQYGFTDNKVVVSSLLDTSGSIPTELEDKIVCFLLSVEEETTLRNKSPRSSSKGSFFVDQSTPLFLNLTVVFCANFKAKNYLEGLNYLSQTLKFFHHNRVWNPGNIQGISNRVEKITFELCNLPYDTLSQVWSAIGSKVLPAAIYKVGVIVIDNTSVKGITPPISSTDSETIN